MNYGLYLSAGGALSSMHRQDVLANNLANMNTVGFKADAVDTRQRRPERLESPGVDADPKWMLERLGGGVFLQPTRVLLAQGDLNPTGNDLDLAIDGDGLFVVDRGGGETGLTRDGRFTLNASSELVMATSGLRVLDASNRPIRLDPAGPARIDDDGQISQNGRPVARLKIIDVDSGDLQKVGGSLLRFADGVTPSERSAPGRVRQGFTEGSTVDPILTLNAMVSAAKQAQGNLKMMQYHDQLLGQTFNTFGRVS